MSAVDTLRDALFGNPPIEGYKPSREGVLKAFTELAGEISGNSIPALPYASVAEMNADTTQEPGTLGYVYFNNGSAQDPANNIYQFNNGVWSVATWYAAIVAAVVQPLVDQAKTARDSVLAAMPKARPFSSNGNFSGGVVSPSKWIVPPPSSGIVQLVDTFFNAYGINYCVELKKADDYFYWSPKFSRACLPGDWVAASILVKSSVPGVWPNFGVNPIRLTIQDADGNQHRADMSSFVELDTSHRRYNGYLQIPARVDQKPIRDAWVQAIGQAGVTFGITGAAIGVSASAVNDVEWLLFDAGSEVAYGKRIATVENKLATITPTKTPVIPIGGDLANGAPAYNGAWFIAPPSGRVMETTEPFLVNLGIKYEVELQPSDGGAYFAVNVDPDYLFGNGDYVMASVYLRKNTADNWADLLTGDYFTISTIQKNGAQPQAIARSVGSTIGYEDINSNLRRIWIRDQYKTLTDAIGQLIVFPHSLGKTVRVSGFAVALSHTLITDIDNTVFDPFDAAYLKQQVNAIINGGSTTQPDPDLLIQSSYHLVQGRPLRLLRDGMTSYRERTGYDIAAVGQNGNRYGMEYASPVMRLDGAEFSGAGFIRAKPRNVDRLSLFQVPTNFNSSPAVKNVTSSGLLIGDSLTHQGIGKSTADKLSAAGVSMSFVGTLADAGGTLGEGRPNWMAANYTFRQKQTNGVNTGHIYDVFPLRPNGGSGLTINVTRSGDAVASAVASGGTGYPNGTWEVVFENQGNNLPGGRRARGRIVVTNGVPGNIIIDDGGAGYTGSVSANITASIAEYIAMNNSGGYGPRWNYNPFLRPATSAEISAGDTRIQNGYIFDFQYYVSTFLNGSIPANVVINLGMNDLWNFGTNAGNPASTFADIRQMITAIRAVSSAVNIAIAIPGQADIIIWNKFVELTKLLMAEYRAKESNRIYILPLFQVVDSKFAYTMSNPSFTNTATGQQTVTVADPTHPDAFGRSQEAEMYFGWIMNRI